MKSIALTGALFGLQAAAFPAIMEMVAREADSNPVTAAARKVSKARTNCGVAPCTTFNAAEQYVSTTGEHKYVKARAGEIRGTFCRACQVVSSPLFEILQDLRLNETP